MSPEQHFRPWQLRREGRPLVDRSGVLKRPRKTQGGGNKQTLLGRRGWGGGRGGFCCPCCKHTLLWWRHSSQSSPAGSLGILFIVLVLPAVPRHPSPQGLIWKFLSLRLWPAFRGPTSRPPGVGLLFVVVVVLAVGFAVGLQFGLLLVQPGLGVLFFCTTERNLLKLCNNNLPLLWHFTLRQIRRRDQELTLVVIMSRKASRGEDKVGDEDQQL